MSRVAFSYIDTILYSALIPLPKTINCPIKKVILIRPLIQLDCIGFESFGRRYIVTFYNDIS